MMARQLKCKRISIMHIDELKFYLKEKNIILSQVFYARFKLPILIY
jgi:hypothetical protein